MYPPLCLTFSFDLKVTKAMKAERNGFPSHNHEPSFRIELLRVVHSERMFSFFQPLLAWVTFSIPKACVFLKNHYQTIWDKRINKSMHSSSVVWSSLWGSCNLNNGLSTREIRKWQCMGSWVGESRSEYQSVDSLLHRRSCDSDSSVAY